MNAVYKIAIRELVEFVYRAGDLDLRFQGKSKAIEGMRIHQKIQKSQGDAYQSEVPLSKTFWIEDQADILELVISGRADGILAAGDGYTIDEIKGTGVMLDKIEADTYPVHWAQAKIYGAIFCENEALEGLYLQLTYASFETDEVKRIKQFFSKEALDTFLADTVALYRRWIVYKMRWQLKRNESIAALQFPYPEYRQGQRKLAVSVYNAMRDEQRLFVQAPTGIGKTLSTLFPAIKAMENHYADKIFYLSAKAVTKRVAEEAIAKLRKANATFAFKSLTLTAKDKVCTNEVTACYPDKCAFAKGHFDRSNDALWDLINSEVNYNQETLVVYAQKHCVCPYEFSLDVALYADCIVCDYNYVFDPRVYLRRFFEFPTESYVFLVDEAHNLISRSRDMFSARLSKQQISALKKQLLPKDKTLKGVLDAVNKVILKARRQCDENGLWVSEHPVEALAEALKKRLPVFEKWLVENVGADFYEEALTLYFDWVSYLRISELYNEGHLSYIRSVSQKDTEFKLFCIDPAISLKRFVDNAVAVVFFSATLSPMRYYQTLLNGNAPSRLLDLPSPFSEENRLLLYGTDVSVKYKDRGQSIAKVCAYIEKVAEAKIGNYMAFFSSFQYMTEVCNAFEATHGHVFDITRQERHFNDADKISFLGHFDNLDRTRSMISFVVMGSHFSEGIDLVGDRLIGAIVVGIGLPMIEFENDLISNYFDFHDGNGFECAYQCPGVNKVMQSAGRVIRDDLDKGVILLIDNRYQAAHYRRYFPEDWGDHMTAVDRIEETLTAFWKT